MDVVLAKASRERATYETSIDQHKYNQKMRQLDFNLKNNVVLTKRLLDKDLEPKAILVMSPDELKAGMAAEEIYIWEQDESEKIQMIHASCPQCMEKKVGVLE
ncbi:uncharacterized protein LOC109833363 [Asparagus officinalis]|nr:uncharacterized protein LOC109833363 [Asparagus officinalis]